jgi:hypothetical protein
MKKIIKLIVLAILLILTTSSLAELNSEQGTLLEKIRSNSQLSAEERKIFERNFMQNLNTPNEWKEIDVEKNIDNYLIHKANREDKSGMPLNLQQQKRYVDIISEETQINPKTAQALMIKYDLSEDEVNRLTVASLKRGEIPQIQERLREHQTEEAKIEEMRKIDDEIERTKGIVTSYLRAGSRTLGAHDPREIGDKYESTVQEYVDELQNEHGNDLSEYMGKLLARQAGFATVSTNSNYATKRQLRMDHLLLLTAQIEALSRTVNDQQLLALEAQLSDKDSSLGILIYSPLEYNSGYRGTTEVDFTVSRLKQMFAKERERREISTDKIISNEDFEFDPFYTDSTEGGTSEEYEEEVQEGEYKADSDRSLREIAKELGIPLELLMKMNEGEVTDREGNQRKLNQQMIVREGEKITIPPESIKIFYDNIFNNPFNCPNQ